MSPTNPLPVPPSPLISSTLGVTRTIYKAFQNLWGDGSNAAYHEILKIGSRTFRIKVQVGHYTQHCAKISLWANDSWEEVHTLFFSKPNRYGFASLSPGMKSKVIQNGEHPLDPDLLNEDREELLRVAMEIVFKS